MPDSASDYSYLEGGLVRMLNRLQTEGTATKNPAADDLLRQDPNALLVGLLFDQRVRAETAFSGPLKLKQRLGHFNLQQLAEHDADDLKRIFSEPPAVHRFTNLMADRLQALARRLSDDYAGDAANLWSDGASVDTIEGRVRALPGFGHEVATKLKHALYYFQGVDITARP